MDEKFVVTRKSSDKEEKYVITTLRIGKSLQAEYDALATESGRSRNEVMCMALRYALEHLEFIPDEENEE